MPDWKEVKMCKYCLIIFKNNEIVKMYDYNYCCVNCYNNLINENRKQLKFEF